ncbi:MAG: SurA N-terminal domain-containing protein [Methylophilaceae bacterium]
MLDNIRSLAQGWLGKVLLAIIGIPLALFGIESYFNNAGSHATVAEVGGNKISVQAYSNALQNMRRNLQSEGKLDPAEPDSPQMKSFVLNQLISKELLNAEIHRAHFAISDDQLSTYVTGMPQFQKAGKFSQELYDDLLKQNNMSPSQFEALMRADLLTQQAQDGFASLGFISNARAENALNALNQQRVVTVAELRSKDFVDQVKVDPAAVKAYYEKNKAKLMHPEQVKIEFLMLSANNLVSGMKVDDAEVKQFYEANKDKFQANEQRQASHILIAFGANPTPEKKQEAKAKAAGILAELKKDPKKFEALAKQYSQDDVSAAKGGELDSFGRGAMVKPFEDAAFSLKVGEISDLVESEFGYHIIKVTGITGDKSDYESLKPQIKGDLLFNKAKAEYAKQSDDFKELVYTQQNSLAPAAKAFKTEIQKSDWLTREAGAKFFKGNTQLMDLVFSKESIKEHRNTEAIEVSPSDLVSARVVEYKPATQKTFDEVKTGIEAVLKLEAAQKMSITKGEADLKDLQAGKVVAGLEWIKQVTIDRKNAQGLTELAMNQAFKTNVAKLPAYSGLPDDKQGYLLVKVLSVNTASLKDADAATAAKNELEAAVASEYVAAYKQSLRENNKVTINEQVLLGSDTNNN